MPKSPEVFLRHMADEVRYVRSLGYIADGSSLKNDPTVSRAVIHRKRTALIDFSDRPVAETIEVSENVYLNIDDQGNVVSMTIEHAKETGGMQELVYREIGQRTA